MGKPHEESHESSASIVSSNNNKHLQNEIVSTSSLDGAVGFCTVCRKSSVCVCARCGDYYCSSECQRSDWQHHRYICFPMPSLVYQTSLAAECAKDESGQTLDAAMLFSQQQQQQQPQQMQNGHNDSVIQSRTPPQLQQQQNQRNSKSGGGVGVQQLQPPNCPLPAANSHVVLMGFRSPNRCYVRPFTPTDDEAFLQFVKKVDTYGKIAPRLSVVPKAKSFAISHLDGVMYRVQVISARKSNSIRILFCDNGITSVRQLSELREISDEILRLPQLTAMVQLRNVENYSLNEKLTAFLAKFEQKEFTISYGASDERGGTVELFGWQTDKCLNEEIVKFSSESSINIYVEATVAAKLTTSRGQSSTDDKTDNEAAFEPATSNGGDCDAKATFKIKNAEQNLKQKPQQKDDIKDANPVAAVIATGHGTPEQAQKPVMTPPFKRQTLEKNERDVEVIVVDNSTLDYGYIGCIAKSDMSSLIAVQKYLKNLPETEQPYKPKADEYCIAKFEGDWYRARVVDIPDETHYTVVYVDFTNENVLTCEDIRRYPSELKLDCRTHLCLIDGLPSNLNDKHVKFLQKEIPNSSNLTIDYVKGVAEEITLIECFNLIQKMHDQGLF